MKQVFFIVGFLFLSLQFCLANSLNHEPFKKIPETNKASLKDTNKSTFELFGVSEESILVVSSESSVTGTIPTQTSTFNSAHSVAHLINFAELSFKNTFNVYCFNWKNKLIRNRKQNLIFPFHYFM